MTNYQNQNYQGLLNQGSQQVVVNQQRPESTSITAIISDFDEHLARLAKPASGLSLFSDRVHGSEPRPADALPSPSVKEPSAGLVQDLRRRRDYMATLLATCEDHAAHIEKGL